MFDDEADTISVDPEAATPTRAPSEVDVYDITRPLELKSPDTLRDGLPVEQVDEVDEADILLASKLIEEASVTDIDVSAPTRPSRPGTNADWPPTPKAPADRTRRRAGMYKAISSITKLNALRRVGSSNS